MHECFRARVPGIFFLGVLGFGWAWAGPAVLIEESPQTRSSETVESDVRATPDWNRPSDVEPEVQRLPANEKPEVKTPDEIHEPLSRRPPRWQSSERWASLSDFRQRRRLGVGASFLGRAGFIGLDAELNVHPQHSIIASFGGGPGYDGASVGYKWIPLEGGWHPTLSLAMAGWSSQNTSLRNGEALPSFFRRDSGQSEVDRIRQIYVIPAVGLETLQLAGDGVGGMIFVEFLFFTQIPTFDVHPIGSVGARYFF